jgi:hypothetical protein
VRGYSAIKAQRSQTEQTLRRWDFDDCKPAVNDYLPAAGAFEACFLRSAQRRFMASAMRLRPSGLSLRLVGAPL